MSRSKKNAIHTVWLHEMAWQQVQRFRDGRGVVILIPVGSVEQHGYHLPMGTDSMLAIRLSEDAAQHHCQRS
jgi:creatinine amidohydrolase